ncbi:glycoside-pentoside-hexuronide (GPH):cation symporter [Klebsiella quasipneumoniae]|uniref:glycoside-pentoside-hexuronide (GPH):cation symporter n=1 Tax=Klebsiella quasipneumoniae TaxID=1463165 RepID=UPI003DA08819
MKDHILSVKEKIGYGMGDAASHIIFDNVMLYMMFFYTDIFGIPAGFVGTMFLLARALDAISDPCMGLLADRTRSRWGKFRPWILFGAIPFGLVCVLAYSSPDLSHHGKLIYAAVTYTLLTLLYTVVNIPYCALGGVITDNPTQRISLQSWRFVLATAGGMLSTVLMMPLVNVIGGEDKALGFQGGIAVLSAIAFLMLAFCFFTTKERVEAPPSSTSMREDLRDIWRNDQWRVVGVLTILNILAVCVRGGAMMYYTTWIMGSAALFTVFLTTYCVGNLIGSALAKPLTDWKCKVSVFWWTNAILAVLSVAMFFVPMDAEITMFVLKLGLALGGALIGWMLAGGGYDAAAKTQNGATLTIIIALFTLVPAVCYLLSAAIAKRYYTLKTPFLKKMMAELAEGARRNEQDFATAPIDKEWQN